MWYVLPEYRSIGSGPELLSDLEKIAKESGGTFVKVGANQGFDAERVGAFYERSGYVPYETHYIKRL